MSVLMVAAPLAFAIGLGLGIAGWKYPLVDRSIKPVLSVLHTLPFFTYLLPAVFFFKIGPTAGAVATVIYAIPPMILMTILGLKKVSPEVVEDTASAPGLRLRRAKGFTKDGRSVSMKTLSDALYPKASRRPGSPAISACRA